MTSIVILAVITALGIACLLICLYALYHAEKEEPVRRVMITRIIEAEQTLPAHQFGGALLLPACKSPLSPRVLQFPVPKSVIAAPAVAAGKIAARGLTSALLRPERF